MENPVIYTVEDVREINEIVMARGAKAKTASRSATQSPAETSQSAPWTMQIPPELLKFSVEEINAAMAIARRRLKF